MNTSLLMVTIIVASILGSATLAADAVPCEKILEDVRAAMETADLSDADTAKVKDLLDNGIERCNADDDVRADEFFAQAMNIIGK